ncbi:uncharacterized protein METZ01_LOCUS209045, partial [marine metagenome]
MIDQIVYHLSNCIFIVHAGYMFTTSLLKITITRVLFINSFLGQNQ